MTVIQHLSLDSFDVQDKQFESTNVYFLLNLGLKKKSIGLSRFDQPQTYFYLDNKKIQYIICSKKYTGKDILWSRNFKSIIDILGNQKYLFYDKIKWELFYLLANLAFGNRQDQFKQTPFSSQSVHCSPREIPC